MQRSHLRVLILLAATAALTTNHGLRAAVAEEPEVFYVGPIRAGSVEEARTINVELAMIAEPDPASLLPHESFADFVKRRCRYADPDQAARLRAINPGASEGSPDRQAIVSPPCATFDQLPTVVVQQGDSVALIAMRSTGFEGQVTQAAIRRLNPNLKMLKEIAPGDHLVLPYAQPPVTVRVTTTTGRAALANWKWASALKPAGAWQLIDRPTTMEDPVDIAQCVPRTGWPFEAKPIVELIQRYQWQYPVEHRRMSTVGVVDTGLPAETTDLLRARLRDIEVSDPDNDIDNDRYLDDLFGVDLVEQRGYPYAPDPADYEYADHGVHVAAIASGIAFADLREPVAGFVRLKMMGAMQALPTAAAGSLFWRAYPQTLSNALSYVRDGVQPASQIINWSWETTSVDLTVEPLAQQGRELIIAAAGNNTQDLDDADPSIYPAEFTRRNGTYAIAVAALRPDGEIAHFSNYGPGRVNIAAPGCAIPTLDRDGNPHVVHGTSFAAPIVSLTAALVDAMGEQNVDAIRNRILVTADRVPELAGKVELGRVLNIWKALALFDTIVQARNAAPCLGRLETPLQILSSENKLHLGNYRRLDVVGLGEGGRVEVKLTYQPAKSKEDLRTGFVQNVDLEFKDGLCAKTRLADVDYLIPPHILREPRPPAQP